MCIVNFVIILSSIIITKMFNNTKSNLSENKKFSRIMRDPRRNFTYLNVDNDDDVIVVPPFPPKPTPPYVPSWSWTQVPTTKIPNTNDYVAVASDNSGQHLLVAAVGEKIRYSEDSGETWTLDTAPADNKRWTNIHSNPNGDKLFACTNQDGIYKSTDGVNWSIINTSTNDFVWNDVVCNEDGSLIIAARGEIGKIYSKDNGSNWTPYTTPDASLNWKSLASNDTGNNLVGCAFNDFIYKSTDGVIWVKKDRYAEVQYSGISLDFQHITGAIATLDPKDWIDITSNSDGDKLAACVENGYIYTSIDSGDTWLEHRNLGPKDWRSITSNSAGDKLAACVNEGYIYTSIDSGYSWTEQTIPGNESWISIASNGEGDRLIICSSTPDRSVWIGVFS